MCRGVLRFLTGPSAAAASLRERFVFKVVPMLNPDGVVLGNTRCSAAGVDLNRAWDQPSRKLTPTIFALKRLLAQLHESKPGGNGVALYVDLHGHSVKRDIFVYGVERRDLWAPPRAPPAARRPSSRVLSGSRWRMRGPPPPPPLLSSSQALAAARRAHPPFSFAAPDSGARSRGATARVVCGGLGRAQLLR